MAGGAVYRIHALSGNLADMQTTFAGNLGEREFRILRERRERYAQRGIRETCEQVDESTLPLGDLPRACRTLRREVHAAGLPWELLTGARSNGERVAVLSVAGLYPENPQRRAQFSWHDGRLFTYGLPMSITEARRRVACARRREVSA